MKISKQTYITIAGAGAVAIIILTIFFTKPQPATNRVSGGSEDGWSRLVDSELGIELEYPSFLSATHATEGIDGKKSIQLYRTIAYGERPGCNESGVSRPHPINYPDISISIDNRSWEKYLADVTAEYGLSEADVEESYKEGSLIGSSKYYTQKISWEGECNYQITYLPIRNHLAVITEPYLFDKVNVLDEGLKTVEELTEGEERFDNEMRQRILTSIQVLD